jgi:hypothetical protein
MSQETSFSPDNQSNRADAIALVDGVPEVDSRKNPSPESRGLGS